jgi:hypothetical protein
MSSDDGRVCLPQNDEILLIIIDFQREPPHHPTNSSLITHFQSMNIKEMTIER